ncbi:MAG TPA: nucleotide exchange factor GrpE [Steroidobacteraceae bacterium]|nr:nucleotide exchange factor GrpE [Steroidobacteraceae bacterium]
MSDGDLSHAGDADAEAAQEPFERIAELQRALAESEQRAEGLRDQYLRSVAELDNVRKRAQRDIEAANRYGLERFAQELLPVIDSLELAVASAGQADAQSLTAGQQATLRLLEKAFDKLNIRPIDPRGEPFDPARHEAVLMQDSPTAEPNSVLQVVQRGYELGGRLLRPARVIVARAKG